MLKITRCTVLIGLSSIHGVRSHGAMIMPMPRNNKDGDKNWELEPGCIGDSCFTSFEDGCIIGCQCTNLRDGCSTVHGQNVTETCPCETIMEPTNNDPSTRSWNVNNRSPYGDWTRYFPWRAPGYAQLSDPCPGNFAPHAGKVETWFAGSTAWAWWSLWANHGGGYQYRLCPKTKALTGECFEEMPLEFASKNYTIQYSATVGDSDVVGKANVVAPATEVSVGTYPPGSTWRRNPQPGCNCDVGIAGTAVAGGCSLDPCPVVGIADTCFQAYEQQEMPEWYDAYVASARTQRCDTGFHFSPPAEGIFGGGARNRAGGNGFPSFRIGDELRVPNEEGDFVLQWRWDCEEGTQIWASCADIQIVASQLV